LSGAAAIHNDFQHLVYRLFGTNFIIGSQIKAQIHMLETKIPPLFKQREMDDLGCGDGKITLLLKQIFEPVKLRGFDIHPTLIKKACSKGIEAQQRNLNESLPSGELAVMWGVLHHLSDREGCLRKIKENYSMAFIREPVKNKFIKGFEMGEPLIKDEIESLVQRYFPEAQVFYYGHCIFIFYSSQKTRKMV
jgi:hypothetical protein